MAKALGNDRQETIIDVEAEDISGLEQDIDSELSAITTEHGGDETDVEYTLKYYRLSDDNYQATSVEGDWMFDAHPSQLPIMNKIRKEYGGGKFRVRVYKKKGNARSILYKKYAFGIAMPRRVETGDAEPGSMVQLFRAMIEQNQQNFNQLREVIQGARPAADQSSQLDSTLSLLAKMKEVFGPPAAPQNSLKDAIGLLRDVKELAGDSDGGGGAGTNIWDVIKSAINSPALGAVAEAVNTARQVAQRNLQHQPVFVPAPPAPVMAEPVPAPQQPPQPAEEQFSMNPAMIRMYVGMMLDSARKGGDPGIYADLILEKVDDATIAEHFLQPMAIDRLIEAVPDVANYRAWFVTLQSMLMEAVNGGGEQPPGAPVHTGDPGPEDPQNPEG